MTSDSVLNVIEIVVHDEMITVRLTCRPDCSAVTPEVARRVQGVLPGLGNQMCVHSGHEKFSEEIEGTQTPHLLEHVTLELIMLESRLGDSDNSKTFVGNTSWHGSGGKQTFEVSFQFDDDLVALAAFREACALVSSCFSTEPAEDDADVLISCVHRFRKNDTSSLEA